LGLTGGIDRKTMAIRFQALIVATSMVRSTNRSTESAAFRKLAVNEVFVTVASPPQKEARWRRMIQDAGSAAEIASAAE
jgi:hypothetical protein